MEAIYSPRLLEILKVLVQNDDYVSTHVLADELNVSNRTVFREIQNVNYLLEPFRIELESKSGYGVRIKGEAQDIDRFIKSLEASQNQLPYRNAQERRELLMIECLMQTTMIKLSNLASIFDVSEGTVSRDLDIIEKRLNEQGLALIRRQGYGIEVVGSEALVRKAIIGAVHKQLSRHNETLLHRKHQDILQYFQNQEAGILGLLNQETIYHVIDVLEHSSTNIVNKITDHSYIGLVIHLAIAVERIRAGDAMQTSRENLKDFKQEPMYHDAKIIISDIETRFDVSFPKAEVGYVLMHLRGTRPRNYSETTQAYLKSNYDCMLMVESLIARFSNIMNEDFTHDESLKTGLLAHLKPTLNRIQHQLEIRNPLLNEIKAQYHELFAVVLETAEILYLENNIRMSDDEIGYLTLHFGAAIERRKHQDSHQNTVTIGVVCASGIGISALLASRIKSTFMDVKEVYPLAVDDVEAGDVAGIDLLVVTLEIDSHLPMVYVNPLLRSEDILEIRRGIDQLKEATHKKKQTTAIHYDWQIVDAIQLVSVNLNQSKEKVIDELIGHCRNEESHYDAIKQAIYQRESHAPVMVESLAFTMYHAKVEGLAFPEVIFFRQTGQNKHKDYKQIKRGLFMIIPYPATTDVRKTMSRITESILDVESLMTLIDADNVKHLVETIKEYMEENSYGNQVPGTN